MQTIKALFMPGFIAAFLPLPACGSGLGAAATLRQNEKKPVRGRAFGIRQSGRGLFQQRQHGLRLLVGLGQHGGSRLLDDLVFRQLAGGRGVVGIHDRAA